MRILIVDNNPKDLGNAILKTFNNVTVSAIGYNLTNTVTTERMYDNIERAVCNCDCALINYETSEMVDNEAMHVRQKGYLTFTCHYHVLVYYRGKFLMSEFRDLECQEYNKNLFFIDENNYSELLLKMKQKYGLTLKPGVSIPKDNCKSRVMYEMQKFMKKQNKVVEEEVCKNDLDLFDIISNTFFNF